MDPVGSYFKLYCFSSLVQNDTLSVQDFQFLQNSTCWCHCERSEAISHYALVEIASLRSQ